MSVVPFLAREQLNMKAFGDIFMVLAGWRRPVTPDPSAPHQIDERLGASG